MYHAQASAPIGKTLFAPPAAVISQTHKRVLLIDCDMRKGYTHEPLGTNNVDGLSDILAGKGDSLPARNPRRSLILILFRAVRCRLTHRNC